MLSVRNLTQKTMEEAKTTETENRSLAKSLRWWEDTTIREH